MMMTSSAYIAVWCSKSSSPWTSSIRARAIGCCFLLLVLCGCPIGLPATAATQADAPPIKISGKTMGPITYSVVIAQPATELSHAMASAAVQATLDRVNGLMSTYRADSDVGRFNRSESTDWIAVDPETVAVVARSLEISRLTGGAFDITVAPVVNLWRFGPDKKEPVELPSVDQVEALKQRVGYQKIQVQANPPAIKKTDPLASIDLSAIAKGYAVDQVGKTLDELGCRNYFIEVGGEVVSRGERPAGGMWRVGIEAPNELVTKEVSQIAELNNQAMATSGDYRNFFVIQGQRYSHTIDPTTCRPVEHSLASACVIATDCMTADAIATAVMVMGAERGHRLCEASGWRLMTMARDKDFGDELTVVYSPGFPIFDPPTPDTNDASAIAVPEPTQSIWPTLIGAFVVISLAIAGMAIGAIFGKKSIRGSCGGLANMTDGLGDASCGVCSKPVSECPEVKLKN